MIEEVFEERPVIQQVSVDVHRPRFDRNRVNQQVIKEIIMTKNIDVVNNVAVPVSEVQARPHTLISEVPQVSESIDNVEIEYLVHKQRPVPVD